MTNNFQTNLHLVRDYLAALQRGEAGEALARFFTPDEILSHEKRLQPTEIRLRFLAEKII